MTEKTDPKAGPKDWPLLPGAQTDEVAASNDPTTRLYGATFAKRLAKARMDRGLSRSDLAREVWGTIVDSRGYTVAKNRDRISVWEEGRATPSAANLKALAAALGMPVADLAPDLTTSSMASAKKPAVSLTIVDGSPDRAVLSINVQVSVTTAARIIEMLSSDPVASAALT